LQGRAVSLGNSPVSLLLPSPFLLPLALSQQPAPASLLRKLGSPWDPGCPWGRPLSCVPCSSASFRGDRRGVLRPPRGTLSSAGGSVSAEE
ncbi:hypothetical protein LEMLEM_LOCUS8476, partial [Lemmus lemmus]